MIFVDTGAWFAAYVSSEVHHADALAWMQGNQEPLLTTDFVLDELLTLLRVRKQFPTAVFLGESLLDQSLARLEFITREDIMAAWNIYYRFRDKDWSFTDCTSFVVMQRLEIRSAFAFDQHFRQFGTVHVVP